MVMTALRLYGLRYSHCTRYICNKFLIQNINTYAVAQQVEWAYAFDVHCNAFIPVYLILYVIQLFFLPLILKENWISMFIGNFMYCVALIWYMVGVFLGFNGKGALVLVDVETNTLHSITLFGSHRTLLVPYRLVDCIICGIAIWLQYPALCSQPLFLKAISSSQ